MRRSKSSANSRLIYIMLTPYTSHVGMEPLTAPRTRKSAVIVEREIIEPRIVKVQNILAVDAREIIRRGPSNARTELRSRSGWEN
jgi:predicted DNA-binding protein